MAEYPTGVRIVQDSGASSGDNTARGDIFQEGNKWYRKVYFAASLADGIPVQWSTNMTSTGTFEVCGQSSPSAECVGITDGTQAAAAVGKVLVRGVHTAVDAVSNGVADWAHNDPLAMSGTDVKVELLVYHASDNIAYPAVAHVLASATSTTTSLNAFVNIYKG